MYSLINVAFCSFAPPRTIVLKSSTTGPATVAHYLKMLHRDMADIAPDHHLPGQRLPPVLLRTVVVVVVHHTATAVVPELQEADCKNDQFSDINNGEKGL